MPPPGPFRPTAWRSPLRGPWLTAVLGSVLLVLFTIVAVTGFASHAAYEPSLPANAIVRDDLPLDIGWPAGPAWLYALTQGLHVNLGLAAIPVLIVKLWSVIPRLFAWPPVAAPAQAVERGMVALLVASAGFELATGVANIANWYPFGFDFVRMHYYGGVVFVAAIAAHLVVKLPVAVRAYRERGVLRPLRDTTPEPAEAGGLAPTAPAAPTITRRGVLGLTGAGALLVLVGNAGQSIGGPLREVSFLAPRRETGGPGEFPVNKTAAAAGVTVAMTGAAWELVLRAGGERRLDRAALLALPQHTARLPIACVEGWSTTQEWTGVRLAELARLAGAADADEVLVESLQARGVLRRATLSGTQLRAADSLLALRVNGADLTPDHGFPARIIVPALPGVHCTKWVSTLTFRGRAA